MNRQQLERYLRAQGCHMHHHGAKHDVWLNPQTGAQTSVPRHATIKRGTVRGVCSNLGIPRPPGI